MLQRGLMRKIHKGMHAILQLESLYIFIHTQYIGILYIYACLDGAAAVAIYNENAAYIHAIETFLYYPTHITVDTCVFVYSSSCMQSITPHANSARVIVHGVRDLASFLVALV